MNDYDAPAVDRPGFDYAAEPYRVRLGDLPPWALRNLEPDVDRGCLEWMAKVDKDGTGIRQGKRVPRLIWKLLVDPDLSPDTHLPLRRNIRCVGASCCAPWHREEVSAGEAGERRRRRQRALGNVRPVRGRAGS